MYLRKQGPGDVTAADIAPPAGVTVHNSGSEAGHPDQEGQARDRAGRRARPRLRPGLAEQGRRRRDRPHPGRLDLLAGAQGHLPRRGHPCRAAHRLRPAGARRRDQAVDHPAGRAGLGRHHPGRAVRPGPRAEHRRRGHRDRPVARPRPITSPRSALPIEEMDLTVRSYNCLKREGIHTVGELVSRTEADLLDIRNFGQKSIDEVKIKLAGMGLSLKDSPAGFDPAAAAADLRLAKRSDTERLRGTDRPGLHAETGADVAMPHAPQGSPSRRLARARAADPGQPGHLAVRARQDHHHRDQGQAAAAATRRS